MTDAERALWGRIESYRFDAEGATKTFADRLARENGWSADYAAGAIEQYRRFVFLSAVAGRMVSPSEPVDQVWHLHLLYTRTYWESFCTEVLGRPFHHEPANGVESQQKQLADAYDYTMDQYWRYFGEPPAKYWPKRTQKTRKMLVNVDANLIVAWRVVKRVVIIVFLLGAALLAFGVYCSLQ